MDSIGCIWYLCDHARNESFDKLYAFKAQNGHCNVSANDAPNKSLGQWVNKHKVLYKKNALRSDHIQQLNSMGFIWDCCDHAQNENSTSYAHSKNKMNIVMYLKMVH
eukprot:9896045-Ditylum_brightwellii.AAC.2